MFSSVQRCCVLAILLGWIAGCQIRAPLGARLERSGLRLSAESSAIAEHALARAESAIDWVSSVWPGLERRPVQVLVTAFPPDYLRALGVTEHQCFGPPCITVPVYDLWSVLRHETFHALVPRSARFTGFFEEGLAELVAAREDVESLGAQAWMLGDAVAQPGVWRRGLPTARMTITPPRGETVRVRWAPGESLARERPPLGEVMRTTSSQFYAYSGRSTGLHGVSTAIVRVLDERLGRARLHDAARRGREELARLAEQHGLRDYADVSREAQRMIRELPDTWALGRFRVSLLRFLLENPTAFESLEQFRAAVSYRVDDRAGDPAAPGVEEFLADVWVEGQLLQREAPLTRYSISSRN